MIKTQTQSVAIALIVALVISMITLYLMSNYSPLIPSNTENDLLQELENLSLPSNSTATSSASSADELNLDSLMELTP